MANRLPIRSLLWFDCAAGGVAGVVMLALSGLLAPLFGIPHAVLVTTALANLAYGAFSYSLARQPEAPRRHVRALVLANFAWTGVCVALAAIFAGPGSWLGAGYLLAEGLFVGALAAVEARALTAQPKSSLETTA
ncbi:MAG: hypothetical protein V4850_32780 [Myxococcota bacterium]